MNKICTSLEQSKKLLELGIDVKTADMHYSTWTILNGEYILSPNQGETIEELQEDYGNQVIPAWSLTALERLMPKIGAHEPMLRKLYYISEPTERYICQYSLTDMTSEYDNPVDAAFEMILKLKEKGLL